MLSLVLFKNMLELRNTEVVFEHELYQLIFLNCILSYFFWSWLLLEFRSKRRLVETSFSESRVYALMLNQQLLFFGGLLRLIGCNFRFLEHMLRLILLLILGKIGISKSIGRCSTWLLLITLACIPIRKYLLWIMTSAFIIETYDFILLPNFLFKLIYDSTKLFYFLTRLLLFENKHILVSISLTSKLVYLSTIKIKNMSQLLLTNNRTTQRIQYVPNILLTISHKLYHYLVLYPTMMNFMTRVSFTTTRQIKRKSVFHIHSSFLLQHIYFNLIIIFYSAIIIFDSFSSSLKIEEQPQET